ncbi:MAG: LLM class F420-dependent oxidoreductase [Alphaproteobacteria bacterium]|nr:LLM class F420-dependent oxidoreductase [Alphaproteobacteria bacterium]MCY4318206.1 LLM class F420-dependent oxidoreductase [Alphaproteobacteria bacterium]
MKLGVVFPQTEIGADPAACRDFAQAAEALGYTHLLAFDHVLGADPAAHELVGPYTHQSMFHEPMVLFGWLAGLTERIDFVTGVLILPQRQTALVAKQAAQVDILSGGRFRLGIGVGWNQVEYQALNEDFTNRGKRSEEQIALLRRLWTEDLVTFEGRWHNVRDAGINPLPVQRPIPVWIGGHVEATIERIGRIGDGWFPLVTPSDKTVERIERLRGYARAAGRDPGTIGIESWLRYAKRGTAVGPDSWQADIDFWRSVEATHLTVNTMDAGLRGADAHIEAMRRVKESVDL